MLRGLLLLLFAMLASPPARATDPFTYEARHIEGWQVLVQNELLGEAELSEQVLAVLRVKLWEIATRLPAPVVTRLREVPIRMHLDREGCPGGVYHPSATWLRNHGFPEEWARGVEFGNARNFLSWSWVQPAMVLHELAHAWHDQVLGFSNPHVTRVFEEVRDSGRLHRVSYVRGGEQPAYAANNAAEFFAEMSEAWWSTNDFYPFVRGEVMRDFPEAAELMEASWAPAISVYILAGQSNMEGKAQLKLLEHQITAPETAKRFAHLHDKGAWLERDDVFIEFLGRRGKLTVGYGSPNRIGPELDFGHTMGNQLDQPVLIIKTAWGGKSLWRDFRPPSAGLPTERMQEILDDALKRGPEATMAQVEASFGHYYREMLREVRVTMAEAGDRFPELKGRRLELRGAVWFQGWNDMVDERATAEYASNMAHWIRDLRRDLGVPQLPVVIGQLGVDGELPPGKDSKKQAFKDAQAEAAALEEWQGSVALVKTDQYWDWTADKVFRKGWKENIEEWEKVGSDFPYHYLGSAKCYSDIGRAFAEAMLALEAGQPAGDRVRPWTVVNYNVLVGFRNGASQEEGVAWIREQHPDVVALQELSGWDESKLREIAAGWGHPHVAVLKEGGFNLGVTSREPLKVVERRTADFHHGMLHVQVDGIDVIVTHLWPGLRSEQLLEAKIVREAVEKAHQNGQEVLLVGDFNAHSAVDRSMLAEQQPLIKHRTPADDKRPMGEKFIVDGEFTFDIMEEILKAPLTDLAYAQSLRLHPTADLPAQFATATFPTRFLGHAATPESQQGYLERIDFMLATLNLAAQCVLAEVKRDDPRLERISDHYPTVARFRR
jgi:exonuclease III